MADKSVSVDKESGILPVNWLAERKLHVYIYIYICLREKYYYYVKRGKPYKKKKMLTKHKNIRDQ